MSRAQSTSAPAVTQRGSEGVVGKISPDSHPLGFSRIEQLTVAFRLPGLSSSARVVLAAMIARCGDSSGETWVGNARLIEDTGLSRSGLKLALASLRESGVLEVRREGRGSSPSLRAVCWARVRSLLDDGVSVGGSPRDPGYSVARGGSPRGPGVGHEVAPIREDIREENLEERCATAGAVAALPAAAASPAPLGLALELDLEAAEGPSESDSLCSWAAGRLCEEARLPGSSRNPSLWRDLASLALAGWTGRAGESLVWAGSEPLDGPRLFRAGVEVGFRRAAAQGVPRRDLSRAARAIAGGAIRHGYETGTYPEFREAEKRVTGRERVSQEIHEGRRAAASGAVAALEAAGYNLGE